MTEISPFIVYLITRLDCANSIVATALIILITMAICLSMISIISLLIDDTDDAEERCGKLTSILKPTAIAVIILLIVRILLPTTKQACAVIVVPAIVNSQTVQKTLPKSIDRIVELAGDYLVDILSEQTSKIEPSLAETKPHEED